MIRERLRRESKLSTRPATSDTKTTPVNANGSNSLFESITLEAVFDCVARAVFETRQRTRALKCHSDEKASVEKKKNEVAEEPSAKRIRLMPDENVLDAAQAVQERKTAPVARPRPKAREKIKNKQEKQTDKDKTKYGNDSFFSSEAGLVATSASSEDSLSWLSHNANELKINDIVHSAQFRAVVYDMDKIGQEEEKEIMPLADPNKAAYSPWRVAVLYRGDLAKKYITAPQNYELPHFRKAVLHLVNVVRDVGVAMLSGKHTLDARRVFESQMNVNAFMSCIQAVNFISFADAIHVRRWLFLHMALHKVLHCWTNDADTSPMLNPTAPVETVEQLSKLFTEKARKGRPKTTKASVSVSALEGSAFSPAVRAGDEKKSDAAATTAPGKVEMVKTAIFHLNKLMDRLWWVPFKLADGVMKMFLLKPVLSDRYLLELATISEQLLQRWDGVTDVVTEFSLGAMGSMTCVADVYRPASGANRTRAPVQYLLDKCSASRSKVRMWKSQYGPYIRYDRRQREFVLRAFMCSMLGNYEHFPVQSHPGFAFRSLLYCAWFRTNLYANEGIDSSRFFEFLCAWQPTLVQHVVRQYMDWACRYSDVIREHRKAMHSSESDLTALEAEISSIVDKSRMMFDRARLMIFTGDVLLNDYAPGHLLQTLQTMDSIIHPRSHAVMLKRNYGKSKLGFISELRARFRTIPSYNADLVMGMRQEVSKWISSYALRYYHSLEWSKWPERFYNMAVVTQQTTTEIAIIVASYLRYDYYELDGTYVHDDDTVAELSVTRAQFNVLRELVMSRLDPFCPKPEYMLRSILPQFGSCPDALELFDKMVYNHSKAQHIDKLCSRMRQYYPMTYSVVQTFAALWERRISLILRPVSRQQLEAQLVVTASRPDLRFFLYCQSCARIRTTVNECDRQKVSTRWASNVRNINVKREGWTPSLMELTINYEETKRLWNRTRPRVMCNETSIFGDMACYKYGSLVKVPAIGNAIEYRNTLVSICAFPGCGTHATIDVKRCAFWQGGYVCSMCTIVLWVIGRRLERIFGIVASPWTIEMPFLETIKNNPSEVVLSRILRKELDDEAYHDSLVKGGVPSAIAAKIVRGQPLTDAEMKVVKEARLSASQIRQARVFNDRSNREKSFGRGRRKPK